MKRPTILSEVISHNTDVIIPYILQSIINYKHRHTHTVLPMLSCRYRHTISYHNIHIPYRTVISYTYCIIPQLTFVTPQQGSATYGPRAINVAVKRPEFLAKICSFLTSQPIALKKGLNFRRRPFFFLLVLTIDSYCKRSEFLAKTFPFWSAGTLLGLNVAPSVLQSISDKKTKHRFNCHTLNSILYTQKLRNLLQRLNKLNVF